MKKILFLFIVITFQLFYSKGQINIFNFSSYDLHFTLLANNLGNTTAGCTPNLTTWGSPTVLSGNPLTGNPLTYTSYNHALVQSPNVAAWADEGQVYNAPGHSVILDTHSASTQWLGSKFSVHDPVTGIGLPNGEWFTVGGATYFIIQ